METSDKWLALFFPRSGTVEAIVEGRWRSGANPRSQIQRCMLCWSREHNINVCVLEIKPCLLPLKHGLRFALLPNQLKLSSLWTLKSFGCVSSVSQFILHHATHSSSHFPSIVILLLPAKVNQNWNLTCNSVPYSLLTHWSHPIPKTSKTQTFITTIHQTKLSPGLRPETLTLHCSSVNVELDSKFQIYRE